MECNLQKELEEMLQAPEYEEGKEDEDEDEKMV